MSSATVAGHGAVEYVYDRWEWVVVNVGHFQFVVAAYVDGTTLAELAAQLLAHVPASFPSAY